jgi:uncharacterized protein (DUF4213/DUF364 family)
MIMKIVESIIEGLKNDAPVKQVLIGRHWTAVVSRACGLSSSMSQECANHDFDEGDGRRLTDFTARELARYALSDDITKASLGLAAINSLIEIDRRRCVEIDGAEILMKKGKGKNVSIIGHFPFVDDVRKVAANLWVMEKWQREGDLPAEAAEKFLPVSDIVVVSSTTLINHTIEGLLSLCPDHALKMLLGPTTPLSEALFEYGIDFLSGTRVVDAGKVLQNISEGCHFRQLKRRGGVELLTLARNRQILQ